jgi:hypothetical protein
MIITFPWQHTSLVERQHQYIALLGLVRLRSVSLLPTFIRFGIRIERQLRRTPGVVGYRTAVDPLKLTFYHLSAWIEGGAIQRFVETQPHLLAVQQLSATLGVTVFRYWEIIGSDIPLQLARELHRTDAVQSDPPALGTR